MLFSFFKILIFWFVRGGVKGQKIVQNDKILSVTLHISGAIYTSSDCFLWYTSVKLWYVKLLLSFFQNFDFSGCSWGTYSTFLTKDEVMFPHVHVHYYLWIHESTLATDYEHFHPTIPTQYHQHWNSFFHFTILCLLELSEDIPFSNVTRIHWLCVGHAIFLNSISQICCNPLVVATQHLISWSGCLREQEANHL